MSPEGWALLDLAAVPTLNPRREVCGLCGQVALGSAHVDDVRYCHGASQDPSCYEKKIRGW